MKQIYHPFTKWEDFQAGMYSPYKIELKEDLTQKAINLLTNQKLFFNVAMSVLKEWPIATDVNLSNKSINRQSWIGQSACCFAFGVPELLTRDAWALMSSDDRNRANKTADKIIRIYERENKRIYRGLEIKGLF